MGSEVRRNPLEAPPELVGLSSSATTDSASDGSEAFREYPTFIQGRYRSDSVPTPLAIDAVDAFHASFLHTESYMLAEPATPLSKPLRRLISSSLISIARACQHRTKSNNNTMLDSSLFTLTLLLSPRILSSSTSPLSLLHSSLLAPTETSLKITALAYSLSLGVDGSIMKPSAYLG